MKEALNSTENVSNQEVTTIRTTLRDNKRSVRLKYNKYFGRYVSVDEVFDSIVIDNITHYSFKNIAPDTVWCNNKTLLKLYRYNSIFMGTLFRINPIPKRCEHTLKTYTDRLVIHLQSTRSNVSKSKAKMVVKHFLKHVSRMYHHKVFTLTYSRHEGNWSDNKTLSCKYMLEFIDLLIQEGNVSSFIGSKDFKGDNTVSSMLVLNPSFIKLCNGVNPPLVMEDCLKVREEKPFIKIHKEVEGTKDKKPRRITREENLVLKPVVQALKVHRNLIYKSCVEVNGVGCPELQYTMVFNNDLYHGGRLYDNGYIQSQSQIIRSTITIAGEATVEKDYSGLHYALACEESGISFKGDPYDFPVEGVVVDNDAVAKWKVEYGLDLDYNPLRNLKKTALLIMFNASSVGSASQGLRDALYKDMIRDDKLRQRFVGIKSCDTKMIINSVLKYRSEVESYFCTGVGKRFQNLDSKMVLYCIEQFAKIGEVCLPVHDSLVVKESLAEFAVEVMIDAYEYVMGSNMNCKIK